MHEINRIWLLMARSLSGEITPDEKEELASCIEADPALQQKFDILQQFWRNESPNPTNTYFYTAQVDRIIKLAESEDNLLEKFEIAQAKRRRRNRVLSYSIGGLAMIILVLLISGNMSKDRSNTSEDPPKEVSAQYGSRSRIRLPDGSTVWLNGGSKLLYGDFTGDKREVKLEGEAFFDVVKSGDRPFLVHTFGIDIKVLGTSFNVKSYADEATFETTLIKGAVEVIKNDGSDPIFLKPNQKITLFRNNQPAKEVIVPASGSSGDGNHVLKEQYTLINLDTAVNNTDRAETAWVHNRLIFHGDNFEQLAKKLERWYNVKVIFEDDKVKRLSFYGSFENETIEQGLKGLQVAISFNYKIQGDEIYISSK